MRCLSCDRRLNDRESVRKYSSSGTFVDLCDRCFAHVADDIPDIDGDGGDDHYPMEEDEPDYQQHYEGDSTEDDSR